MHFTLQDILHLVLHGMLFFEKWSRYCVIVRFKVELDLTELLKMAYSLLMYSVQCILYNVHILYG